MTLGASSLRDPTPRMREDVFGERTKPTHRTSPAPLVVGRDGLRLFAGGDRFVGEFTRFEPSAGLGRNARLETSAGRDPDAPAFVGYRLGRGTVVRVGTPGWTRALAPSALGEEVPRATVRIWRLLRGSR